MSEQELLEKAINIYRYGSFVYGTNTKKSDEDFIVIVEDEDYQQEQLHIQNKDYNIYKESDWIQKCQNNDVECIECKFLDKTFILKETKQYDIPIDYTLIRKNFSKMSSNSFVKCKKKLLVEENCERIGKKSLWHSLRLILFAIQIMEKDKIQNYQEANIYYQDIVENENNNWEYYKDKYQPIYNQLKTKLRIVQKKPLI